MNWIQLCLYLIYLSILLSVSITDLREMRVPNKIIGPAILFALAMSVIFGQPNLGSALAGGFAGALLLLLPSMVMRKQMFGMGDVKLAFFMGLILGFGDIWNALLLASIVASLMWVGVFFKWVEANIKFPFAPFLAIGTLVFLTRSYFMTV